MTEQGVINDQDEPTCSLRQEFDTMFYCYSIGGQATNYYRYGTRKDCKRYRDNLRFCWRTKFMNSEEKKKAFKERAEQKEEKLKDGPNCLDIWELREQPPVDFPPVVD
ncbi:1361_t:CDS:2 [Paraglomus brasilianum]|uniref:1361_t:CDS:1 n=1 Tax=Paraglomus brasilianum TaxID=144538 RepID=A0A9N9A294_9GLOM|nr:1361_t:CDS:2 [Paraglomus brasilianum]